MDKITKNYAVLYGSEDINEIIINGKELKNVTRDEFYNFYKTLPEYNPHVLNIWEIPWQSHEPDNRRYKYFIKI